MINTHRNHSHIGNYLNHPFQHAHYGNNITVIHFIVKEDTHRVDIPTSSDPQAKYRLQFAVRF